MSRGIIAAIGHFLVRASRRAKGESMSNQEPAPQVAQTQPPVKPQGKKPAPPPRARRNWDVEKRVFLLFAALSGF